MTTGLTGYSQGGEGYLGTAISWRPGDTSDPNAFVAPTQFLIAETKALEQEYTHIEHDAYLGSRDNDAGHRHGKGAAGGPFSMALYPTNGADVWEAAIGFKGAVSGIAADTTTAIQNGPMAVPTAPTTTPSASGGTLAAGVYEYAVEFGSSYGLSTPGAPTAGDTLSGASSSEALAAIATGPPGTTFRNIYRKKDAGPWGIVHTLNDNTTVTWTDTGAVAGAAPPAYNTSVPANVSVLTLAAGDANYALPTPGRPVYVDVGLNQEIRGVLKYDATNKYLFVGLLGERDGRTIAHSSAGTAVQAVACSVERPIIATDYARNFTNQLPRVCAEDNVGGKYSEQYRGGLVGKLDLKASTSKVMVDADIMFNKPRQLANGENGNPSPTAFDDGDVSLNDLSYEYQDGFLAIDSDQGSVQQSMLQRMDDAVDWEINFNNNLKEEAPMDGTSVKRFLPGSKRKIDIKVKSLNPADYPVIYDKFVSKDLDATFLAQFAINEGTDAIPVWKARFFYLPHVRYVKSIQVQGLTETVGESFEGIARRANGLEKIYVYSL